MPVPLMINELDQATILSAGAALAIVQTDGGVLDTYMSTPRAIITEAETYTPPGSGAIAETVSDALQRLVHTAQYSSAANYQAARDALTGTIGVNNLDVSGDLNVTGSVTGVLAATMIDAKGDLVAGTADNAVSRLAIGSDETRLVADSTQATGLKYVADTTNYAIDAKGDLLAGTAEHTLARKAAGTDGYVLAPSSGATDGLAWVGPGFEIRNGFITASVAANALTIALKGADGNDPSATNPVFVVFRNATAGTGTPVDIKVTGATSLVGSSGSTFGSQDGAPFRLWIVGFNDANTFRLGLVKATNDATSGAVSTMALRDDLLLSSTAEGGLGAADAAQVIYTGTAVASKALRILGYVEWGSGLATAGTWSSNPTKIQPFGYGVPPPSSVVQALGEYKETGGPSTTSTSYVDVTNGSLSITPTSSCNFVRARFALATQHNESAGGFLANTSLQLLRGSTSLSEFGAFGNTWTPTAHRCDFVAYFEHYDIPHSTSAVTYKTQIKVSTSSISSQVMRQYKSLEEIMG